MSQAVSLFLIVICATCRGRLLFCAVVVSHHINTRSVHSSWEALVSVTEILAISIGASAILGPFLHRVLPHSVRSMKILQWCITDWVVPQYYIQAPLCCRWTLSHLSYRKRLPQGVCWPFRPCPTGYIMPKTCDWSSSWYHCHLQWLSSQWSWYLRHIAEVNDHRPCICLECNHPI